MKVKEIILIGLFAAITAILAQIAIPLPITPVPITFQVLAVCLAGAILGSRLGTLSILVYLLLGAAGLPVFAKFTGGISIILGPTGGYLIAFPIAAFIIGKIIEKSKNPNYFNVTLSMLLGLIIIYLFGMTWLSFVTHMTLKKAFIAGVLSFIPLDIIKIIIAAVIVIPVRNIVLKEVKI